MKKYFENSKNDKFIGISYDTIKLNKINEIFMPN
jgi:hypothetical protein